ncbi:MAG TPA: hypothetical protein VLK29_00385, partial [Luteimonas sp.]|nr:hypothetical protein [Luteimonas sp.]
MRTHGRWLLLAILVSIAGALGALRGCGGSASTAALIPADPVSTARGGIAPATRARRPIAASDGEARAAGVAAPSSQVPAQTPGQARCTSERQRQLRHARDGLQPGASPREALAHALLSNLLDPRSGVPDRSGDAFHAARERWPHDVDLAWASAMRCRAEDGCDRHRALRRLAEADGGNASVWMQHMQQARLDNDRSAYASALQRAAAAPYYDTRAGSVFLAVRP